MLIKLVALNAHYMHTNLAIRQMLAAANRPDGVVLLELNINLPVRDLLERIADEEPCAIGFSTYIWNAGLVWRLCRALRLAMPGVTLFAGGPEVAPAARETLSQNPALDCVLAGEGEVALLPFIKALQTGEFGRVPGLFYRKSGEIMSNPLPAEMESADWPDVWGGGLCDLTGRILYTETSRGCPYRCAYCLSGMSGKVRSLDAAESISRLTAMARNGAKLIKLVDRTFNFDKDRANEVWRGLIGHSLATGLMPTYHFEIGAHLLDDQAFDVLSRAPKGLFQFEAGIQSSDERVLDAVGRGVSFESLRAPLARVVALKTIHLHVDLIAGLPGETLETFARSFDDAFSVGAEKLQLGFLKLLKGSALRRDAKKLGIVFEPDPPYEVISTPGLSFADLCFLKDVERVLEWYHNSLRYQGAVKYLLRERTPFALFAHLARLLRAGGAFGAEQGEKARAAALLDAFDAPVLREIMAHDLLLAGRRRDLPDALEVQEDRELRALLREKFHPVRGQSARRYECDVEKFLETGELIRQKTVVVYPRLT